MNSKASFVFVALFAAVLQLSCFAQEYWPEFRGPTADGHAAESAKIPVEIDESTVQWKTPIHGRGWSSPVVWGDRIWLTTATPDGKTMSAVSVDVRSGEVLHDIVIKENEEPDFCHKENSYASPTAAIDKNNVFIHFGRYATVCLNNKTGEEVWRRDDLECDHWRGPASSPILFENLLIVAFDGYDQQYVIAMDRSNGETVWKRTRDIDYGTDNGDLKKAYGTATIIEVAGQPQLVYPSAIATVAYNPRDGEPLWTVYHGGMNASSRPVEHKGLVFITNGMGRMVAVKSNGKENVTESHVAWLRKKNVPKKSSVLIVDDLMYLVSDEGVIACVEPTTGEDVWKKRMSTTYAASPVYVDGRIYFFSRDGDITTLKPGRSAEVLAESKLGDGFWASPAIVGNRMILRSQTHLYCVAAEKTSVSDQ